MPLPSKSFILLVDDDHTLRETLALKLHNNGFDIHQESDASRACLYLKNNPVKPDLIVMDLNMPEMTGLEFCTYQSQTAHIKDIPLILMTANHALAATSCKNHTVLLKPFSCSALFEAIRAKLTHTQHGSNLQHPDQNLL